MSAYRYDGQGQRISKRVTGSNLDEFYILDGRTSLGVVTVDGAGNTVSWSWNVLAGDKVVGRETQTAQRLYYHTDLLGSTRVVVQGTTIVEAYDYDPWGVRLEGRILAGPTKEGFTTKERDAETGLDYFGARYYMAALGRWGVVDPLAEKHLEWSPYNYVLNNPAVLVDPDGRQIRADLGDFNPFGPHGDVRIAEDGRVVADREGQVARAKGALLAIGLLPLSRAVSGGLATAGDIATGNFTFKGALLNFLLGGKGKVAGNLDAAGEVTRGAARGLTNLPFRSGDVILREFQTSKGVLDVAAEAQIAGRQLLLNDIAVFPRGADALSLGAREVAALRNQLAAEARALGFEQLRITGTRISGANPGKAVDVIIDLTR